MNIPVAANVLGTLGAVCWSVQLIPQIVINYRRHDTTGLQPTMMLLWASAGVPLGVYNIAQSFNVALRIQPQILTFLSLVTWAQCKYYGATTKWSWVKCVAAAVLLGLVMGGVEAGLVFGLKRAVARREEWPAKFMAVLAAVLLSAGVLRHYWDIYRERTVRGISFLFVGIDAMGDLTSLLSVFFQPELDILGLVIYGSELLLWLGVFACGGWYNLRPKLKKYFNEKKKEESEITQEHSPEQNTAGIFGSDIREGSQHERPVSSSSSSSSTVFRTASSASMAHELRLRNLGRV